MARFSLIPKEEQYFSLFRQMTSHIYDAASKLAEMLAGKASDFQTHLDSIKAIEHTCDELTHSISKKLNTSFITPFDREDIYMLSGALDDIVDLIDDAARAVVMYNVRETTDYARQFGDVIQRMAVQHLGQLAGRVVDVRSHLAEEGEVLLLLRNQAESCHEQISPLPEWVDGCGTRAEI